MFKHDKIYYRDRNRRKRRVGDRPLKRDVVQVRNTAPAVRRSLTPGQYDRLAEVEWLANITNPKTRRAYKIYLGEFSVFAGHRSPERTVVRAQVIAWRKDFGAPISFDIFARCAVPGPLPSM